jgi:hypothetical protein
MTTMFSSLVPAMLNVEIHNDSSCVASTITAAHAWMATYGPLGINVVAASSYAWTVGEPMHQQMDAYNNGRLCAPHRNEFPVARWPSRRVTGHRSTCQNALPRYGNMRPQ